MRNLKLVLALAGALVLSSIMSAIAQTPNITGNTFQTGQAGKTVQGNVDMCLNAANVAVPCGSSGALPSNVTGNVGGFNITVPDTPVVQASAYSSGNAIGGLRSITFFRTIGQASGILNNIAVTSKGGATTPLTFYIFTSSPTATTCTDKTAFVLGAADIAKLIAMPPPVLTPAVVGAGTTTTQAGQQLPISVKNGDSGPVTLLLYVCIVVGGAVTPASTSDLVLRYAGIQD